MCGVFGYVGQPRDVAATIVDALKMLEYRGYDSWGLAVATADGLLVEKHVGRINGHVRAFPDSSIGLGHTRWATHGGVTQQNAHPHADCTARIAVVHNGIVENHGRLRAELASRGHRFSSDTDSETIAHLVEEQLGASNDLAHAVASAFGQLTGHNAIVVMDALTGGMVAAKRTSPLVIGISSQCSTVASDAFALEGHADRLIYLEDGHLAVLRADAVAVFERASLRPIAPPHVAVSTARQDSAFDTYPDFLSKEVAEQPAVLLRMAADRREEIAALAAEIRVADRVVLTGCGSAGNAALAGVYFFNEICGLDATCIPASELRHHGRSLDDKTLIIALSQSGETLDVLEAVDDARQRGARLAAIVNTANSSLARKADTCVLLGAGVEQCVLATKSYTAMLGALLLTSFDLAREPAAGAAAVGAAARAIQDLLGPESRGRIEKIGSSLAAKDHLFVIGRGTHYPSALEAALKIKEVSYIHAEGFAAGELKHGVIALIELGTPCLVLAPDDGTRTDMLSSAAELRSRGGHIIGIGATPDPVFDEFIPIQSVGVASPIVEAVPGQLLGYAAALARGHDPDRPRNLAKSVTVK